MLSKVRYELIEITPPPFSHHSHAPKGDNSIKYHTQVQIALVFGALAAMDLGEKPPVGSVGSCACPHTPVSGLHLVVCTPELSGTQLPFVM